MRYMKPSYYDSFRCLADQCPASCCEGWQIMIDEKSLKRYWNWDGKLRGRLINSIDWEEGAFLQYDRKCAFLNEQFCVISRQKQEKKHCAAHAESIRDMWRNLRE